MKNNNPELKFEVGVSRKIRTSLRGKIEQGVVRAVIPTTSGVTLNVSFGPKGDLAASVNAKQVVGKLPR
jgi:hypothetical protein